MCYQLPGVDVTLSCPTGLRIEQMSAEYGVSRQTNICDVSVQDCRQVAPHDEACCGLETCTYPIPPAHLETCGRKSDYYHIDFTCGNGKLLYFSYENTHL